VIVSLFSLKELEWWHALVVVGISALFPVFRAIAVVLVARGVDSDIAKLAIPLILNPVRPSLFPRRKTSDEENSDNKPHSSPPKKACWP
jgi:hypothetical protein